jgi:predicted ferric reductase
MVLPSVLQGRGATPSPPRPLVSSKRASPSALPRLAQPSREGLVAAGVAAGVALVIAMWWHDTNPASLRTAGDWLTAAGRVTGLVGAYLVLVEVVLMGRLPWLDRWIGMDRLAVWHRLNGEYSIGLLVAHAVLIIWGYALADHTGVPSETRSVLLSYPDVLAATVGLLLLVGVGAASARAARRRLKYQTWYFIHLYTYIAIALSFAHQLATGNDFVTHPLNRALWVAMYLATAGLLIWYRIAVPARNALRQGLRVANVVPEGPGVASLYITGRRLGELNVEAGQFFLWRFLTRDGWWQAHPFSVSAAPNGRWLRITVKSQGDHTTGLQRLRPGVKVIAEGPYGTFTRRRRTRRKVLLIAGGIGITPLRALFEALPAGHGELTLIYREADASEIVFQRELDELAWHRGATIHYVLGHRRQRSDPLGANRLRALVEDLRNHDVYVCGPPGMMAAATSSLRAAGVPRRHIHTERFEF